MLRIHTSRAQICYLPGQADTRRDSGFFSTPLVSRKFLGVDTCFPVQVPVPVPVKRLASSKDSARSTATQGAEARESRTSTTACSADEAAHTVTSYSTAIRLTKVRSCDHRPLAHLGNERKASSSSFHSSTIHTVFIPRTRTRTCVMHPYSTEYSMCKLQNCELQTRRSHSAPHPTHTIHMTFVFLFLASYFIYSAFALLPRTFQSVSPHPYAPAPAL